MSALHDVDEYGVTNYKTRYLAMMGMIIIYIIIAIVQRQHQPDRCPTRIAI